MQPMPGHRVEVFSLDGTDLGPAHVPPPVGVGDVLALVCGPPLKIVSVFHEDEDPVAISVRPLYVTTGSSPEI
jgi:hypothetical protein